MRIPWAKAAKTGAILLAATVLAAAIIGYLQERPTLIDF